MIDISAEDLKGFDSNPSRIVWTEEEDDMLLKLREEGMSWEEIAPLIPGRNSKMCYSRYQRLQNQIKFVWKKADKDLLKQLV